MFSRQVFLAASIALFSVQSSAAVREYVCDDKANTTATFESGLSGNRFRLSYGGKRFDLDHRGVSGPTDRKKSYLIAYEEEGHLTIDFADDMGDLDDAWTCLPK